MWFLTPFQFKFVFLYAGAVIFIMLVTFILYPSVYPSAFVRDAKIAEYTLILMLGTWGILAAIVLFQEFQEFQERPAGTWNEVVRRANRGRTVRLANLTEAQDPVSLESFEEGQQIALLPAGRVKTPFQLNTVQRLRSMPRFAHPTTRRVMANDDIEVVRIA
jgi:hypothetical protein